jgi:hypothetical protein
MLKKGSIPRYAWHDRYFVFRSDNTLQYFKKKGDESSSSNKLKGVYDVSECEVSDLFVSKHNKEIVYCVRLTFASSGRSSGSVGVESTGAYDIDDSSDLDDTIADGVPLSPVRSNQIPPLPITPEKGTPRSPSKRRNSRHKRHVSESAAAFSPAFSNRSFDTDSLAGRSSSAVGKKRSLNKADVARFAQATGVAKPEIPTLVEVDDTMLSSQANNNKTEEKLTSSQRILTPHKEENEEEREYLRAQYLTNRKLSKSRNKRKIVQGTKLAAAAGATVGLAVVTAGAGLVAGLILFGAAAAGGGSGAIFSMGKKKDGELIIASADFGTVKKWKSCFDAAVESENVEKSTWGHLFATDGRKARLALLPPTSRDHHDKKVPITEQKDRTILFESGSKWRPLSGGWASFLGTGVQGLRISREEREVPKNQDTTSAKKPSRIRTGLSVDGKPCAPFKAHVVLSTSALDAFLCLMSYGCVPSAAKETPMPDMEHGLAFRIIEAIDDNTDVIHLVSRPLFLFPTWVAPRDFVLYRYWRFEEDGSYMVCYESVEHNDCPPHPDYVRGEMHKCFTIAPLKKVHRRRAPVVNPNESLMTAVVQVDPRGWVPTIPLPIFSNQSYGDAFGISVLLQLLEIRDAIDLDRFVPVSLGQSGSNLASSAVSPPPGIPQVRSTDSADEEIAYDHDNYDFAYAGRELSVSKTMSGLISMPPPLDMTKWADIDGNSFRVRGKHYLDDKKKFNAGSSIGRLVAVDVVSVAKPIYSGFTLHPTERVQLALQKEAALKAKGLKSGMAPFVFAVNICIPGPPFYHAIFYYAVDDRSKIDGTDGTPSSKLCNEFFFGDSDEFRDSTFKLIPQIVQGNFIVRKAVGSTPAVLGKKLRQLYVRDERFFEIVLDW